MILVCCYVPRVLACHGCTYRMRRTGERRRVSIAFWIGRHAWYQSLALIMPSAARFRRSAACTVAGIQLVQPFLAHHTCLPGNLRQQCMPQSICIDAFSTRLSRPTGLGLLAGRPLARSGIKKRLSADNGLLEAVHCQRPPPACESLRVVPNPNIAADQFWVGWGGVICHPATPAPRPLPLGTLTSAIDIAISCRTQNLRGHRGGD